MKIALALFLALGSLPASAQGEIDLPDNPAWKSFKFKLTGVETKDEAAWESFQKKQLQPRTEGETLSARGGSSRRSRGTRR